jgi:hypothetical protein
MRFSASDVGRHVPQSNRSIRAATSQGQTMPQTSKFVRPPSSCLQIAESSRYLLSLSSGRLTAV